MTVRSHFTFKQRNFDPETRQLRNRDREDAGEDTVEKAVEGLAEDILKEDEEKRKEELVSHCAFAPREDRRFGSRTCCVSCAGVGYCRHSTDNQDLFNIQPKRANWDLKRDMTNRMSKLDRKTNEAIATLFRESTIMITSLSARPLPC